MCNTAKQVCRECEECGVVMHMTESYSYRRWASRRFCGNTCRRAHGRKRAESRFWARVKIAGPTDCWEWLGHINRSGYGQAVDWARPGHPAPAHRVAWWFTYQDDPGSMCVCHHCDNRACVNPGHLFLGDYHDNMRDCSEKGRISRGDDHSSSKLTEADARAIRSASDELGLSQGLLASMFGVTQATVSKVIRRKTWRHVL